MSAAVETPKAPGHAPRKNLNFLAVKNTDIFSRGKFGVYSRQLNRGVLMKRFILTALVTLAATQSFGAVVKSARLDASKRNILVDVTYGGCGKHEFTLEVGACGDRPAYCLADLVEKTTDMCEKLIVETVVLNIEEAELSNRFFSGATIEIQGDQDWRTKKRSSAKVVLPVR